jgi:hypothetical protein
MRPRPLPCFSRRDSVALGTDFDCWHLAARSALRSCYPVGDTLKFFPSPLSAHKFKQSLLSVRETAKREPEESLMLKVREKEEQIASMQRQVEELRRKAEKGSQQLQGEVQELELERLLCEQFPFDQIEAVPKGEFGGDVIQYVTNSAGQRCGAILWETKRTKNWNDRWLAKLRED